MLRFETNGQYLVIADGTCNRCRRPFLAGERILLMYAGSVTDVHQGRAFVNTRDVNQWTEHENIDNCTEGR